MQHHGLRDGISLLDLRHLSGDGGPPVPGGRPQRRARWRARQRCRAAAPLLTLMEHAGVPISIISKWAGHYDAAFTQRTYVHASDDDLEQGRRALARIHKIA